MEIGEQEHEKKNKIIEQRFKWSYDAWTINGCGSSQEVDLTKGLTVGFEGYDGYGYADIDSSESRHALTQDLDYDRNDMNQYAFWSNIGYEVVDERHDYENGDKVAVKATYDENLAKQLKIKVTNDTKEFKVKGLKKVYRLGSDFKEGYIEDFQKAADEAFEDSLSYYDYDGHAVTEYKKLGTYVYYDNIKLKNADSQVYSVNSGIMNVYAYSFADFDDMYYDDDEAAYNPDTEEVDGFRMEYIASDEGKMPKAKSSNMSYEQFASSEFFDGKSDEELFELFKEAYDKDCELWKGVKRKVVSVNEKKTDKETKKSSKKKTTKKKTSSKKTSTSKDSINLEKIGGYKIALNGLFTKDSEVFNQTVASSEDDEVYSYNIEQYTAKENDKFTLLVTESKKGGSSYTGDTMREAKNNVFYNGGEFFGSEDKYLVVKKYYDNDTGLFTSVSVYFVDNAYPSYEYSITLGFGMFNTGRYAPEKLTEAESKTLENIYDSLSDSNFCVYQIEN